MRNKKEFLERGINLMFDFLVPDGVSTYTSDSPPANLMLLDGERKAASAFSERRLRDFAHGRYCARNALSSLGLRDVSIDVGRFREPVWPAEIVGSITHTDGVCAAAACRSTVLDGLGIDCESNDRLNGELINRICGETERNDLISKGLGADHYTVLFSAKESVYKCIWRYVRRFVHFDEVVIKLNPDQQQFDVSSASDSLDAALIKRLHGRWLISKTHVYTTAFLLPLGNERR